MANAINFFESFINCFLRVVWMILLIGSIILIVLKLFNPSYLQPAKFEYLLGFLLVLLIIPYLGKIEAFGVKIEIRKTIEDLDARVKALPDYLLGSQYYDEGDLQLAEQSYLNSLENDKSFWPSLLGLGSIAQDQHNYGVAIGRYNKILTMKSDEDEASRNVYAHNNLADLYLYATAPYRDEKLALFHADEVLRLWPSLGSGKLYKAEALNRLKRYEEALPILNELEEQDIIPKQEHWVIYEKKLSNSHHGIQVKLEDFRNIYRIAISNGEGEYFLDMLKEESPLFPAETNSIIEAFLSSPSIA